MSEGEWYERWFGEEYLHLYPHRDAEEAQSAVSLVLQHAGVHPDLPVLDLACGAGRHLEELRSRGRTAFGLDLSMPMLNRAHKRGFPVVRGDMRDIPFAGQSLGLVTSFFTSFGYFDDPDDDAATLKEVRRVLRPEGVFALDYLNAALVRADLETEDSRQVGDRRVSQRRALLDGGRFVEKTIQVEDPSGSVQQFHERVRLYDANELLDLLEEHGLVPFVTFGDYSGAALHADSPRVIVLARTTA